MTNNYLHKEYELCFAQLRYYDERQNSLLKFFFSLTTAAAASQFAIYKLFNELTDDFFLFFLFLSVVVVVCSFLIFLSMVQNRLYFVFMARQINALRGHLLNSEAPEFKDNQLYISTDFSAIKPFSVHTYQLVGVAFITALFSGSSTYSAYQLIGSQSCWSRVLLVSVIVTIGMSLGGYFYLSNRGTKTADEAIHHQN